MRCIYYLDEHREQRAATNFIRGMGDGHLSERWASFVTDDNRARTRRNAAQNNRKPKRRGPRNWSGLSSQQRQVRRFMKALAEEEKERLERSLYRLQPDEKLDSSSEYSEADSDIDISDH
jgi:hypothetical protein